MKRKTVSLCIIVRDEEANIGATIKSVLALVDEVIVADTGSRDNTSIIAEGYGARVVDVPWEDDFAAVRNRALATACGDWILVLDADEFLQSIRPVEFQRLLHDPSAAAYRVAVTDEEGRLLNRVPNCVRLFRNHPLLRFTYPLRDDLEAGLAAYCRETGHRVLESELVVVNEGQTPQRTSAARERDQRILRLARDSQPQEPFFAYLSGIQGLSLLDDEVLPTAGIKSSLEDLDQAWRLAVSWRGDVASAPAWLPELGCRLVSGRLAVGHTESARKIADELVSLYPHLPSVLLQSVAADLAHLVEIWEARGSLEFRQCVARIDSLLDRISAQRIHAAASAVDNRRQALYPLHYRGRLALLEGMVSEAVTWFERALDLDPSYSFAWLGMAECCEFASDRKRALKLYLRTAAACPDNYRAWLQGSRLMRRMDCPGNAVTWWNRFCRSFPEHPAVKEPACEDADCQTC